MINKSEEVLLAFELYRSYKVAVAAHLRRSLASYRAIRALSASDPPQKSQKPWEATIASDTKLLLTKDYSQIIIFEYE